MFDGVFDFFQAGLSSSGRSLLPSSSASSSRRGGGSSSGRRVPVITSAELRAIYRAREIRRQQRLLEQQRQLAHMSQIHSNTAPQQNLISHLLTPQSPPQTQPQSQQHVPLTNDMLRNLLLAAFLGNNLNAVNGGAQVQTAQQAPTATTGSKAVVANSPNTNNNPVVIETNGSIQLSEVKKANGQTHIVIDASSMGLNPLTATLKPGEDPPEPEIKFGHRK